MKKLFIIVGGSLLFSGLVLGVGIWVLKNPVWTERPEEGLEIDGSNQAGQVIEEGERASSAERMRQDVQFLTEITPARNHANVESLNQAADYIAEEFEKRDCDLERQKFQVRGQTYQNIICSFEANQDQLGDSEKEEAEKNGKDDLGRIIVGAHYDVDGDQPGADDNASAVAGLLELGRLLNERKPSLKHRVDLVAYSLEELPYFRTENMGSAVHARSLKEAQVKVEVMICLEMIGYFTSEENSQAYPTDLLKTIYPTRGDFIAVIGRLGQGDTVTKVKRSMLENSTIPVQSISAPASLRGIDFSDHQNYWKAGWEAVMITDTSFYRNPNYHQSTDTIDTLDFEKMEQVMEGVYGAVTEWQ